MAYYPEYQVADVDRILQFIKRYPFSTIAIVGAGSFPHLLFAPVIYSNNRFEFHIALSNPHFQSLDIAHTATLAFHGPNAPISPSWYQQRFKDKPRSHTAPTWDYAVVQAEGHVAHMPTEKLKTHLSCLVETFELQSHSSWKFDEIDPDFLEKLIPMIKGYYFSPTSMRGLFKLSQDQTIADQMNIISSLEDRDSGYDKALALFMRENLPANKP